MDVDVPHVDSSLITDRLFSAVGMVQAAELSRRAGTWDMFCAALTAAREPGADGALLFSFPKGVRGSGLSLAKTFASCKSGFCGYRFGSDGYVYFSPLLGEDERLRLGGKGSHSWKVGVSGLSRRDITDLSIPDLSGALGAGATSDNYCIVPLEDVLIVVMLAALQVYLRTGDNGTYSVPKVIELLRSESLLALGRSCVVGSVNETDIGHMLNPSTHCGVGLGDLLVLLGDWQRHGSMLCMTLPTGWVVPCTPLTRWPAFYKSSRGAIVISRDHLSAALAGATDREFSVTSAGVRTGARGDGSAFIVFCCIRHASRRSGVTASIALGCPRRYQIEL